jgi:Na+-driven multidrug efflux pump
MTGQSPSQGAEARRCRRFGWTALAAWSLFGLVLEAAYGFKLSVFLDDQLRHTLLRLAHAHGVILALVVLAFGGGVASLYGDASAAGARRTGALIRVGALVVPLGFALSAIAPHEGDPGFAVLLVPVGALPLIAGLLRAALRAWRRAAPGPEDPI